MIEDLFTDLVTVEALASGRDAGAGVLYGWSPLYTHVACRIEDASAQDQERFARRELVVTHEVFTTQPGITVGHRLTDEGRSTPESPVRYLVRYVIEERAIGLQPGYSQVFAEEQRGLS